MNRKRVVITGMGALAPNGNNVTEFWSALLAGKSGIDYTASFDTTNYTVKISGELKDFDPEKIIDPREIRKLDRFAVYAIVASSEAIDQAKINWETIDQNRIGVILGTGVGGIQTLEAESHNIANRGPRRVSPHFVPKMIANIAAGQISIRWGLKGPNQTITSACASATDAIGIAMRLIQVGDADMIITGGTEASVTPLTIAGFANMRALSTRNDDPRAASRPFDRDRDGFILSEGAGILIIESEEHAKARGVPILAELAGYGATDDAFHITQPAPGGMGAVLAMKRAIDDAGILPSEIDYINAHGTSTPYNDKNETSGIKTVFGQSAKKIKISSTKSMTGHLLGATGAIEAIASIKAIENNIAPPTINYSTPDPDCDLDYIPNEPQSFPINVTMSNTFGFGGHNAVIVIRRWAN